MICEWKMSCRWYDEKKGQVVVHNSDLESLLEITLLETVVTLSMKKMVENYVLRWDLE